MRKDALVAHIWVGPRCQVVVLLTRRYALEVWRCCVFAHKDNVASRPVPHDVPELVVIEGRSLIVTGCRPVRWIAVDELRLGMVPAVIDIHELCLLEYVIVVQSFVVSLVLLCVHSVAILALIEITGPLHAFEGVRKGGNGATKALVVLLRFKALVLPLRDLGEGLAVFDAFQQSNEGGIHIGGSVAVLIFDTSQDVRVPDERLEVIHSVEFGVIQKREDVI